MDLLNKREFCSVLDVENSNGKNISGLSNVYWPFAHNLRIILL